MIDNYVTMMFAVLIICLMPLFCELKPVEDSLVYNLTDLNGNPYGIVRIKRKSPQPAMSEKMYHSRRYRQKDNLIDSVLSRGDAFEEQDSQEDGIQSGNSQKRNFRKTKQNIVPERTQPGSSKQRFMGQENDYVKDKSLSEPKKTKSITELSKQKKISKDSKELNSNANKPQIKKNHDLSPTPEKTNTKKKISSKQEPKTIATDMKTPLQEKHARLPDKGESKKANIRNRSQAAKDTALPGSSNKKSEMNPRRLKEDDASKTDKSGEQKQISQMKKSARKSPSDNKQRKPLNGNTKLKTM